MPELRFQIFGRRLAVVRQGAGWLAFDLGPEGKRRPASLPVPDWLAADELCQYLADLLHESASPAHPDARRTD